MTSLLWSHNARLFSIFGTHRNAINVVRSEVRLSDTIFQMQASTNAFQSFREKTKNALLEASNKGTSPFERWTSDSLKCLLISHNVQVRGSTQASRRTLSRICDELFTDDFDGDEKDFVRVYTMETMLEMDKAARLIQSSYIQYRQRQTQPRLLSNLVVDIITGNADEFDQYVVNGRVEDRKQESCHVDAEEGHVLLTDDIYGNGKQTFSEDSGTERFDHIKEIRTHYSDTVEPEKGNTYYSQREDIDDRGVNIDAAREGRSSQQFHRIRGNASTSESYRDKGEMRKDKSGTVTHKEILLREHDSVEESYPPDHIDILLKTPRHANSDKSLIAAKKAKRYSLDQELDTGWAKPSFKLAKEFEAKNRPHRSGKGMKSYEFRSLTTGRHCMFGGCGEQLDLWNEGQMSELAQFGSGITNYFKVCPTNMLLYIHYLYCHQFIKIKLNANQSFKSGVAGQCLFLPSSMSLLLFSMFLARQREMKKEYL